MSLNTFLEKPHEYFIYKFVKKKINNFNCYALCLYQSIKMFFSNDRKVIGELIEQLFNKLKKVDCATKILQKSIKDIVN